jgi:hypothetical protein
MDKDIGTVFPGDEPKTLGVIKPFNLPSFLHYAFPPEMIKRPARRAAPTEKQSDKKKEGI